MILNDDIIEYIYKLEYNENNFQSCLILRSLSKQWHDIFAEFVKNETLFEKTLKSFNFVYSQPLLKKYKLKYMFTARAYDTYKYQCVSCGNYNDGILTCTCHYSNPYVFTDYETLSPPFSPTASTISYWSGDEEYV